MPSSLVMGSIEFAETNVTTDLGGAACRMAPRPAAGAELQSGVDGSAPDATTIQRLRWRSGLSVEKRNRPMADVQPRIYGYEVRPVCLPFSDAQDWLACSVGPCPAEIVPNVLGMSEFAASLILPICVPCSAIEHISDLHCQRIHGKGLRHHVHALVQKS